MLDLSLSIVYNITVLCGKLTAYYLWCTESQGSVYIKNKRKVLKMKLAKKMLAGVLALAMVAALALTAFAATSTITVTPKKDGDKLVVTVDAKDMAGLESADLQFKYDTSVLKYVSVDKAADSSYEFYDGGLAEEDASLVTWSFYYREKATADCGICVITFEVLKDEDTKIDVIVESWTGEGIDGHKAPASVAVKLEKETTTAPTTAAPTTAAPTTAAPTEATSKVPTTGNKIPQTGEAGVAAIAGVMVLAAVAFVATRKKDEE